MKTKQVYVCTSCGAASPRWSGQCASCREWNTLAEEVVAAKAAKAAARPSGKGALSLADAEEAPRPAAPAGMEEMDRLLGGGLVPGSAVLLGGEPGIGKSTLLLQLAGRLAAENRRAVYVSGEESLSQLRARAKRLDVLHPELKALSTSAADQAEAALADEKPELMVVDSVQTMASSMVEGAPGSVSQVRAVAAQLVDAVKRTGATLVLVGHVTKEGRIAGPRLMEHMVDTVLYLEGDRRQLYRILRVLKNRYGPTDDLSLFEMRESGLESVPDPSTFFLGEREENLSGSALVMAVDGHKPFAVEVQALAGKSYLSIPRRTALGFDANRLHLLLAVLEKHLRVNLGETDVYAKIGGGLKLSEPGLDLGIAAAVLSSFYDRPLPAGTILWGEIDLNGRIRPCAGHETRQKQARRLGYRPLFSSGASGRGGVSTLADLQARLFGPPA